MALLQHRFNPHVGLHFRYRNQLCAAHMTASGGFRGGDPGLDIGKRHGEILSVMLQGRQ
jgi:hypothetical protein